jgi:hypothetical protein
VKIAVEVCSGRLMAALSIKQNSNGKNQPSAKSYAAADAFIASVVEAVSSKELAFA